MENNNEITVLNTNIKLGGLPFIITEANSPTNEKIRNIIAPANKKLMESAICHN